MGEERKTIREVASGKIEVVFNGVFSVMQFNCACSDALPYCKALCCRLRTSYTVILQKDEIGKFKSKPHPHSPGLEILQDSGGNCTYLDEDALCGVHEAGKPWACTAFHCSPEGKGEGITHRQGGWFLSPNLVTLNVDDEKHMVNLAGVVQTT